MDPDSVPQKKKTVLSRAVRHSTAQAPEVKTLHQASFDFQKIKNGEKLVVDKAMKGLKAMRVLIPTNKYESKPAAKSLSVDATIPGSLVR